MSEIIQRAKHDIYPFISPSSALKGSTANKTVVVTGGGRGIGKVRFTLARKHINPITLHVS